jgi:hypothetical protein
MGQAMREQQDDEHNRAKCGWCVPLDAALRASNTARLARVAQAPRTRAQQ